VTEVVLPVPPVFPDPPEPAVPPSPQPPLPPGGGESVVDVVVLAVPPSFPGSAPASPLFPPVLALLMVSRFRLPPTPEPSVEVLPPPPP
jgi:hypothetical protein